MDFIKSSSDYSAVYRGGRSKANRLLVLYTLKNNLDTTRCGISVSKKVGNSVVRHRLKRQLKEIFKASYYNVRMGYDIVIVVRVFAKEKTYDELNNSYINLIKRHGLLNG